MTATPEQNLGEAAYCLTKAYRRIAMAKGQGKDDARLSEIQLLTSQAMAVLREVRQ